MKWGITLCFNFKILSCNLVFFIVRYCDFKSKIFLPTLDLQIKPKKQIEREVKRRGCRGWNLFKPVQHPLLLYYGLRQTLIVWRVQLGSNCLFLSGSFTGCWKVSGQGIEAAEMPNVGGISLKDPFPLLPCSPAGSLLSCLLLKMLFSSKNSSLCCCWPVDSCQTANFWNYWSWAREIWQPDNDAHKTNTFNLLYIKAVHNPADYLVK